MILTQTFDTPAEAIDYFNAPANAALRLVSLLPPLPPDNGTGFMAIYDNGPQPRDVTLEEDRLMALDDKIISLWHAPAERKEGMNFPRAIIHESLVPLSIVSNRLRTHKAFAALSNDERTEWIRESLDAVGCAYVSGQEAREKHGCAAELVWIKDVD